MASITKREWLDEKTGKTKTAYAVRWKEGGKHKSQGGFALKKEAQDFKLQVEIKERERRRGGLVLPVTMKAAIDAFMKDQELRVKDGIISQRFLGTLSRSLDRGAAPIIGDIMTDELRPYQVEEVYKSLRKAGNSPTTSRVKVRHLQLVCDYAVRRGWMPNNPAKEAIRSLRGIPAVRIETFDLKQVQALLAALSDHGKEINSPKVQRSHAFLTCAVHLAMFCGLRFGEIIGLQVKNVDLKDRTLRIRTSMLEDGTFKGPKTKAGYRDVPLPENVAVLLADWYKRFWFETPLDLMFVNTAGGHFKASNFHPLLWRPLLKRAGLHQGEGGDGFHFHALRHFAASWMVAQGMPLTDTAAMLGHSKFDTTLQVYAHPLGDLSQRRQMMDGAATLLLSAQKAPARPEKLAQITHG